MAALLRAVSEQITSAVAHSGELSREIRGKARTVDQGLSFLQLKNQLLAMYLSDLTYLMLRKVTGNTLKDEPALLRLVEIRTVLEKMRPMDQKLRYQIDKLVKTAVTGCLGEDNPLIFRPNPGNLLSKLDEEDEEAEEEEDEEGGKNQKKSSGLKSRKIYIPPRLVPMHYDAEQTGADKERKVLERAKKRALSSSVIRELQEQYTEAPEEVREGRDYHAMRHSREDHHRVQYEESMMVRLNVSKKDREKRKRSLAMTSQLGSLTHFGSIGALTGETLDRDTAPRQKKRKIIQKKKKKAPYVSDVYLLCCFNSSICHRATHLHHRQSHLRPGLHDRVSQQADSTQLALYGFFASRMFSCDIPHPLDYFGSKE